MTPPITAAPLRILHLEDKLRDRQLVTETLAAHGLDCTLTFAGTHNEFEAALRQGTFEAILSDFTLPSYNGMQALAVAQELRPEIPFIFVSGTIGEDRAVASLKSGATDYVLKDHLEQLVPAIRRALREAELRRARRETEAKLRESEERYRQLVDLCPDAIFLERAGNFAFANSAGLKLFGAAGPEDLVGKPVLECFHPDSQESALRHMTQVREAKTQAPVIEQRCLRLDGSEIEVEVIAGPFQLHGQPATQVILRDVTARKQAEADVRRLTERLRLATRAARIGIWDHDLEKNSLVWDDTMYELYGISPGQFGGVPEDWWRAIHPEDRPRVEAEAALAHRGEKDFDTEFRVVRADGSVRTIRANGSVQRDRLGRPVRILGANWDITELKRLEADLRQAQKMEAVGQLAGGVAHDFNNLLAAVRLNTEILLMEPNAAAASVKDGLQQVVFATERAANLTRQLLTFSRKQVMQPKPLSVNEVATNLTRMLCRIIGENIRLECTLAADLPLVQADTGMIEQVIVNLVVNSRDAMPRGGQLVLATEAVVIEQAEVAGIGERRPGRFVCLAVTDSGTGIAPELLPRIFEPFFTTKEAGKGTGLGLATVYGIVKQHEGWVEVCSRVGEGTTFRVLLPALSTVALKERKASPETEPRGGTETILLVEDDLSVRVVTRRLLERFKYRVYDAASYQEALEIWKQQAPGIALLLTDVLLPDGATGLDLAKQLRAEQPGLKIVFMSGYSGEFLAQEPEALERIQGVFLQKPCPPKRLLETLRRALDGSSEAEAGEPAV